MVSKSSERVLALQKRQKEIKYLLSSDLKEDKFEAIYSCASREYAIEALQLAQKIADENSLIILVNGFNEKVLFRNKNYTYCDLNEIRKINSCGMAYTIFTLFNTTKKFKITGHRGCDIDDFKKAYEELKKHSSHYYSLIERKMRFDQLAEFFSFSNPLPLDHRGKILIEN